MQEDRHRGLRLRRRPGQVLRHERRHQGLVRLNKTLLVVVHFHFRPRKFLVVRSGVPPIFRCIYLKKKKILQAVLYHSVFVVLAPCGRPNGPRGF